MFGLSASFKPFEHDDGLFLRKKYGEKKTHETNLYDDAQCHLQPHIYLLHRLQPVI